MGEDLKVKVAASIRPPCFDYPKQFLTGKVNASRSDCPSTLPLRVLRCQDLVPMSRVILIYSI